MNTTIDHEPTEAEIQHQAYLLWIESGRLPGRDLQNWNAAREFLKHRVATHSIPGRRRSHSTGSEQTVHAS